MKSKHLLTHKILPGSHHLHLDADTFPALGEEVANFLLTTETVASSASGDAKAEAKAEAPHAKAEAVKKKRDDVDIAPNYMSGN